MLIEDLFAKGVMTMGASKADPKRQVGVFRPETIASLPALRAGEMEKFRWIAGEWSYENHVPATRLSPAYTDVGSTRFSLCERGEWICAVAPDRSENCQITFDPLSRQWICVLTKGSYGILRSPQGWSENRIVFSGLMTMIGIDCQWRMSWTKESDNAFGFVNEELGADGCWHFIDEWQFYRE